MPTYSNITITTNTGLEYQEFDFVQLSNDADTYIIGRVVSYNPSNGQLVVTPYYFQGAAGSYSKLSLQIKINSI